MTPSGSLPLAEGPYSGQPGFYHAATDNRQDDVLNIPQTSSSSEPSEPSSDSWEVCFKPTIDGRFSMGWRRGPLSNLEYFEGTSAMLPALAEFLKSC